ncbi:hypothetical protein C8Q73DRAFT_710484 [Cubamyces lactineus]|nr:hypothetical protein C8Q73DRAFT_710484 [Cubamyces lactineus]
MLNHRNNDLTCFCEDSGAEERALNCIESGCFSEDVTAFNSAMEACHSGSGSGPVGGKGSTTISASKPASTVIVTASHPLSTPQTSIAIITTANSQTTTISTTHTVASGTSNSQGTSSGTLENKSSSSSSKGAGQTSPTLSGLPQSTTAGTSLTLPTVFPSMNTSTLVTQSLNNSTGASSSFLSSISASGASPTVSTTGPRGPSATVIISLAAVLGLVVLISVVCGLSLCARRRRRRTQQEILRAESEPSGGHEDVFPCTPNEKHNTDEKHDPSESFGVQPSFPSDRAFTSPSSSISVLDIRADTSPIVKSPYSAPSYTSSSRSVTSGNTTEGVPLLQYGTSEQDSTASEPGGSTERLPLEVQPTSSRRDSSCTAVLPTITEAEEDETPPSLPSMPPGIIVPARMVKSHEPATTDTEIPIAAAASATASATPEPPRPSSHADVPPEDEKGVAELSEKTAMSEGSARAGIEPVVQGACEPGAGLETVTGRLLSPSAMTSQYPDATTDQTTATRESAVFSLSRGSRGQSHPRFLAVLMDLQASDDQDQPPPYQPRPEGIQMPLPPHIQQEGPDRRTMS